MTRFRGLALVVAGLLIGCHSNSLGPVGPFAGHWVGIDSNFTLDITLSDQGGLVKGSGSISGAAIVGGTVALALSGTENSSTCDLTVNATGYTHLVMTGALMNDTTLATNLNGSGFANYSLTTYRQH